MKLEQGLYVDGSNRLIKLERIDGTDRFRGNSGLVYKEDGTASDGIKVHDIERKFNGFRQQGAANLMLTVALNATNPNLTDEQFRDFVSTSYTAHEK